MTRNRPPPERASVRGFLLALVILGCEATVPAEDVASPDVCEGCGDTSGCADGAVWAPEFDQCVQCNTDNDCPGAVCHPTRRQCVACLDDSGCGAGVCHPERLYCVECLSDGDCGSGDCDEASETCRGCGADSDCDDGNACTTERCIAKACESSLAAEGSPCEADPCTAGDRCVAGTCTAGDALERDEQGAALSGCQPCDGSTPCAAGQVCVSPAGVCGAGRCEARPADCALEEAVCGCDGVTYSGDCRARAAGTSVAFPGKCPCTAPALPCALSQGVDTDGDGCLDACRCDAHTPCASGFACPSCEPGLCASVTTCDDTAPVCGCDGETWSSACAAADAGRAVAAAGACCTPPTCPLGAVDLDSDGCAETCPCETRADCAGPKDWCQRTACGAPGACRPGCDEGVVCGCDGVTRKSSCDAPSVSHAGKCCPDSPECVSPVDLDSDGCADACACAESGECAATEGCRPNACGAAAGQCAACDGEVRVCGCDGRTWPSECAAFAAGVAVSSVGPCPCPEGLCGAGQYCQPAESCGSGGSCLDCPAVDGPVCTCAGTTAASRCKATAQGLAIAHIGECVPCAGGDCCPAFDCPAPGKPTDTDGDGCPDLCVTACTPPVCGAGISAVDDDGDGCPEVCPCKQPGHCTTSGQYCARPKGSCGGVGRCVALPAACQAPDGLVCGCDGVSYAGECAAAQAGVSVSHLGACCPLLDCPPATVAGDSDGDGCADVCEPKKCVADWECGDAAWYCARPTGSCAAVGTCELRAVSCAGVAPAPVCGCDGVSYVGACDASAAGVSVAASTACKCKPVCASGDVPLDANGDGCPEGCVAKCGVACDCQAASGKPTLSCPAPLVAAWTCSTGGCKAVCSTADAACK